MENLRQSSGQKEMVGPSFLAGNNVSVYVMLAVLLRMRTQMGLEAMLEYMAHYMTFVQNHNPLLYEAVNEAMAHLDVQKIHTQLLSKGKV